MSQLKGGINFIHTEGPCGPIQQVLSITLETLQRQGSYLLIYPRIH